MRLACLILLILIPSLDLYGFSDPTFIIESEKFILQQKNDYRLGLFDEKLTQEQVLDLVQSKDFKPQPDYEIEFGKYYYFAYVVDNRLNKTQRTFLKWRGRFPFSEAFLMHEGRIQPFERHPDIADLFSTDIPPGRSVIIGGRLCGSTMRGKAAGGHLYDPASLMSQLMFESHTNALVFGAVGIMILYNLGMLLFFRKIYFFYYAIYSGATMYAFAAISGYFVFIMPYVGIASALAGISLILFCNGSLALAESRPRLHRFSYVCILNFIVMGAYTYVTAKWTMQIISLPLTLCFCIYTSIKRWQDGFKPALYFLVGWTFFVVSLGVFIANIALIGSTYLNSAGIWGFALEVCFFSFAIGQKVRLAEQAALRESAHAFNQLKKVFYAHQIQQIKQGAELEKTMPTGRGDACVLSFDIIGSSQIKHPNVQTFLENSIKGCLALINRSYDQDSLEARGYRIKEMGDGFLCSVGYPFPVPGRESIEVCAMTLALSFTKVFQEQVEKHLGGLPVYCSIGLAMGPLEGYFPKTGTVEYDVFGRAIILATRYEAIRKLLFPSGPDGHLITLHQKVYDALPPHLQKDFIEINLADAQMVVRDDLEAKNVYYRIVKPNAAASVPAA